LICICVSYVDSLELGDFKTIFDFFMLFAKYCRKEKNLLNLWKNNVDNILKIITGAYNHDKNQNKAELSISLLESKLLQHFIYDFDQSSLSSSLSDRRKFKQQLLDYLLKYGEKIDGFKNLIEGGLLNILRFFVFETIDVEIFNKIYDFFIIGFNLIIFEKNGKKEDNKMKEDLKSLEEGVSDISYCLLIFNY
jgi:hypothetical protein